MSGVLEHRRSGLVLRKEGMSAIYSDNCRHAVTVLSMLPTYVVSQKTQEHQGYDAVCIATRPCRESLVSKSVLGQLKKAGVEPCSLLKEFRVSPSALIEVGCKLSVNHFVKGQLVDVFATSIGKGFAGVMKRHNFSGLRASHGVSVSHRSHGSTGQCQDPGKVFKGKKMAGHMGASQVTVQNLEILRVDSDKGIVVVKGAVPGHRGSFVNVCDAVKYQIGNNVPFPTFVESAADSVVGNS